MDQQASAKVEDVLCKLCLTAEGNNRRNVVLPTPHAQKNARAWLLSFVQMCAINAFHKQPDKMLKKDCAVTSVLDMMQLTVRGGVLIGILPGFTFCLQRKSRGGDRGGWGGGGG